MIGFGCPKITIIYAIYLRTGKNTDILETKR
jgi:hypothetical protein